MAGHMLEGTFAAASGRQFEVGIDVINLSKVSDYICIPLNLQDLSSQALALEKTMEYGKSVNEATDRDKHDNWAFRAMKKTFDEKYEEWVCTTPEKLKALIDEMEKLSNEVSLPKIVHENAYLVYKCSF